MSERNAGDARPGRGDETLAELELQEVVYLAALRLLDGILTPSLEDFLA